MGLPLQSERHAWSLVSALTPTRHVVPVTALSTPSRWGVVSCARFCRDGSRGRCCARGRFMPFMGPWGAGVHSSALRKSINKQQPCLFNAFDLSFPSLL